MQYQQKSRFLQSFGGLNFIIGFLTKEKFPDLVSGHLGHRHPKARYSYGDILSQLALTSFIGGDCLDDNNYLRDQLRDHPFIRIASPDTIEYAFQELRRPTNAIPARGKNVLHQINKHTGFNRLLTKLCGHYLLPNRTTGHMMDYDGHIVENSKPDNNFTYKHSEGYYPVVCSIDKFPVYMENRNGNSPEGYRQHKVIEQAIVSCEQQGIAIGSFRADACCYNKKTVEYLDSNNITYYIRAGRGQRLMDALVDEPDWEEVMLNNRKVEVCEIEEPLLGAGRRVVAYRHKVYGQLDIEDKAGYRYSAVITSDKARSPLECIEIYNQRGCGGEHHFKELDYDFNWNRLPFDNMEMNTIYMYAMMVAYLLFNICKKEYAEKLSFVDRGMRLKNFILHFVTVPARWIRSGRRWICNLYTQKEYGPLWDT